MNITQSMLAIINFLRARLSISSFLDLWQCPGTNNVGKLIVYMVIRASEFGLK